jgi:hypothetical protein
MKLTKYSNKAEIYFQTHLVSTCKTKKHLNLSIRCRPPPSRLEIKVLEENIPESLH